MKNFKKYLMIAIGILALNTKLQAITIINETKQTINLEIWEAGPRPKSTNPGELLAPIKLNKKPHQLIIKPKETLVIKITDCTFLYIAHKKITHETKGLEITTTTQTTTRLLGSDSEINNDRAILLEELTPENEKFYPNAKFFKEDFQVAILKPKAAK